MENKSNVLRTALHSAETALQEALFRQRNMERNCHQNISEVVHDIKNPLTAMIGNISLIRNEVAGPIGNKVYQDKIRVLESSTKRLLDLCNSLLSDVPESGITKDVRQPVDVSDLINEVMDLFEEMAAQRDIVFKAHIDDMFPLIEANPNDLFRALMNLVSNAIKFTPGGGNVEVIAKTDAVDGAVIMVVRDSGVGMSLDQIRDVTQPGTTSVSPHGDVGTGFGLAIVNRIIADLGGSVDIVSSENRGTRIKLKFPSSVIVR